MLPRPEHDDPGGDLPQTDEHDGRPAAGGEPTPRHVRGERRPRLRPTTTRWRPSSDTTCGRWRLTSGARRPGAVVNTTTDVVGRPTERCTPSTTDLRPR